MKKRVIKNLIILAFALFIVSSGKVYAASCNISASTTNAYVGDSVTINVNIFAGTWNLHVNGSGISDTIAGFDMDANVNTNKSYSLNTQTPGTYTVTLTGDITDYVTDENTAGINKSVTVTISERPAQPSNQQPNPEPSTPANNTPSNNTNTNNNSNNTNTNTNNNTTTKQEEKKEEEKKEEVKVEKKLKVDKFEIIGYDLAFNVDKTQYELDILDGLNDLYIIVEGENLQVTGDKKVSILGKDKIEVEIKSEDISKKYIIKLNRISKNSIIVKQEDPKDKWTTLDKILLTTTLVFLSSTLGLGTMVILNKKKNVKIRRINGEENNS